MGHSELYEWHSRCRVGHSELSEWHYRRRVEHSELYEWHSRRRAGHSELYEWHSRRRVGHSKSDEWWIIYQSPYMGTSHAGTKNVTMRWLPPEMHYWSIVGIVKEQILKELRLKMLPRQD